MTYLPLFLMCFLLTLINGLTSHHKVIEDKDFKTGLIPSELLNYILKQNESNNPTNYQLPDVDGEKLIVVGEIATTTTSPETTTKSPYPTHYKPPNKFEKMQMVERIQKPYEIKEDEYDINVEIPRENIDNSTSSEQTNTTVQVTLSKNQDSLNLQLQNKNETNLIEPIVEKVLEKLFARELLQPQASWILGALYKLPPVHGICQPDTYINDTLKLVTMDLTATQRLENSVEAYECAATKTTESKYFGFFGDWSRSTHTMEHPITNQQCRNMISKHTTPDGKRFFRLRWDKYGTMNKPSTYYSWPHTITSTVYNYYVTRKELTIDPSNGQVSAPNVDFINKCWYTNEVCKTTNGILMWTHDSYFMDDHKRCVAKNYKDEVCILSRHYLSCPTSNLLITDIFTNIPCATLIAYSRTILTVDYAAELAQKTFEKDFVKYSGQFSHLYENAIKGKDKLLSFQLGMCKIQEPTSFALPTAEDRARRKEDILIADRAIKDKIGEIRFENKIFTK